MVGKHIRVCTYEKQVIDIHTVAYRKNGATKKQFSSNPRKYAEFKFISKNLGYHRMYEDATIVSVLIIDTSDMESSYEIRAMLSNGMYTVIDPLNTNLIRYAGKIN